MVTYRRVKAIEALVLEDLVPGGGDAYPAQVLLYHVHPSVCNFKTVARCKLRVTKISVTNITYRSNISLKKNGQYSI